MIGTGGRTGEYISYLGKIPRYRSRTFELINLMAHQVNLQSMLYELLPPNHSSGTVLVHYMGDERAAVNYAHGNAKSESPRPYVRTCPSMLQGLKDECKTSTAVKAYRSQITQITSPAI